MSPKEERKVLAAIIICVGGASFGAAFLLQELRYGDVREQLHYMLQRVDGVGDMRISAEADKLRRRIAGLLASPKMYLRARRLLGPLDLDRDEITAELEIIESVSAT